MPRFRLARLLVLAACSGKTDGVTPTSPIAAVQVSVPTPTIYIGQTKQATATVLDRNGAIIAGQAVTWKTSDASKATVGSAGQITGIATGAVQITASAGPAQGSALVTIAPVPVATVAILAIPAPFYVGQSKQLAAIALDSAGNALTGRSITWSSGDTTKATVTDSGLVRGVAAGAVTITATSAAGRGTANLTILLVPIAKIVITPSTAALAVPKTIQLVAVALDSIGGTLTNRTITWSSSDPTKVRVTGSGFVTTVGEGTATIIGASEGKSASVTISGVLQPAEEDVVLVDTRPGGKQSWQGQGWPAGNAKPAMDRLLSNGSAVTSYEANEVNFGNIGGSTYLAWVPDFDGSGLSVMRGSMNKVADNLINPDGTGGADGGGGKISIGGMGDVTRYDHWIFQYRHWMGRTEQGGGLGTNGLFTINDQRNYANGPGRKLVLSSLFKPAGGIYTNDQVRVDYVWGGVRQNNNSVTFSPAIGWNKYLGQTGPTLEPAPAVGCNINYDPFNASAWISKWHTHTIEWKNGSTETSADGLVRVWEDGVLVCEALNQVTGRYWLGGFQVHATFRSPTQDQSEYIRDIAVWVPK